MYNYHTIVDNAYHKVCFVEVVEVVEVVVLNVVFRMYIGNEPESYVYKVWIFVEDLLKIVRIQ